MKYQEKKNKIAHCNLCDSDSFIHLFDEVPIPEYTFSVIKCKKCRLISTRPIPDDNFLAHLYGSESYKCQTVSGTYCLDEQISSVDFTFALHKLSRISRGRKLLDVGCGVGTFVHAALDSGWDSYGIEPSTYAGAIAQGDLNDRIHQGSLASAAFAESSFDVITLWYVLEHVTDPTHVLSQVHTLLKKGGIVFIAVPNAYYIFLRRRIVQLIRSIPGTVHPHEHLYQYTSKTLKGFLYKTGFSFISEHSASPYMVSGPYVNFGKHLGKFAVDALFLTTGINMGGILMFGRKTL